VMCYISNSTIVCANSGDSRAILCSVRDNNWYFTQLSRDHKPEEQDEAARIKKCNGRIEPSRLQPGMLLPPGVMRQGNLFYGPKRVWLKNK
jgi:serine/threonine protein phosphatase PrpC